MTLRATGLRLLIVAAFAFGACSAEEGCAGAGRCTGVITDISSAGIGQVESFELKAGDETLEILIADDVDYEFDLGHLHEHLATSEPVLVDVEERNDGDIYARSIEDA
ncbi:MAG: hypothetical protein ACR2KQ_07930 [Actinomycetota bacterium]